MAQPENKILVLTNPNNPTGTIFPREDLERIADLSRTYGVLVYSDEIFADITFHGKRALLYADVAEDTNLAISSSFLGFYYKE